MEEGSEGGKGRKGKMEEGRKLIHLSKCEEGRKGRGESKKTTLRE